MVRLLAGVLLALLVMTPASAGATTDGGNQLQLLAVAGSGERFAIVADRSLHEDCAGAGCKIFVVDVAMRNNQRLHQRKLRRGKHDSATGRLLPNQPSPLQRYLSALSPKTRRLLQPIVNAAKRPRLPLDQAHLKSRQSSEDEIRYRLGKNQRARLSLVSGAPFKAAAVYDRLHLNSAKLRQCIDPSRKRALCSACKLVPISVGAKKQRVWSCEGLGQYFGASKPHRACDCRAEGVIKRLRLQSGAAGNSWLGSAIVAVPLAMGQNWMGAGSDVSLDLGTSGSSDDMHLVQLRSGLLAFGAVANARFANGTFFPAFVAAPNLLPAAAPLP